MHKKYISLLLSAVFLLLLCPAAAAAEEPEPPQKTVITEVALFVDVPAAETVPPTEPADAMTGGSEAYRVSSVSWSPEDEAFRKDVLYTVVFQVVPGEGYTFAGPVSATVNGLPADCAVRAKIDPETEALSPYVQVTYAFAYTVPPAYSVTVLGGTADVRQARVGAEVRVTAGIPVDGGTFDYWTVFSGDAVLEDIYAPTLTFLMPAGDVTLRAVFKEKEPDAMPGDVNGDGKITAADARLALRAAVGLEIYEPGHWQFLAANVDHNSAITAADARKILRAAVGLEDPLLWE